MKRLKRVLSQICTKKHKIWISQKTVKVLLLVNYNIYLNLTWPHSVVFFVFISLSNIAIETPSMIKITY